MKPVTHISTNKQAKAKPLTEAEVLKRVTENCRALDKARTSPPIEITIGEYAFYPYRGFSDILQREDFRKLTVTQLRALLKITDEILALQRPELFEAFVHDDGVIAIDKAQPHAEYSIDIEYNDNQSHIEEVYPQVTYPQRARASRVRDEFIRNDTAHEVSHHADYWVDMEAPQKQLDYLHSTSTLLVWLKELDLVLRPHGVANLLLRVRDAEGYVAETLLEEGYSTRRVDQMLHAEFFAIAGEFYYGSKQKFRRRSPLLEAYMRYILDTDLQIQQLYTHFKDIEKRRGVLRKAVHAPVDTMLGADAAAFYRLRKRFDTAMENGASATTLGNIRRELEQLVIRIMGGLCGDVRKQVKLEPLKDADA